MAITVSTADLRTYLDQVPAGAQQDATLQLALNGAISIVEDALSPIVFGAFPASPAARDFRTDNASRWLRLSPHLAGSVTAVAQVHNYGTAQEATEALTDWAALQSVYLYREAPWGAGAWYRVTARWGYGEAPDSIRQLVLELAVNIWRSRDKGMFTETVGAEGGGTVRYIGGLNRLQQAIIANVKRRYAEPFQ